MFLYTSLRKCNYSFDLVEQEKEYLTFILNGEEFGVYIFCVQELRVWSSVTESPNKPDYIKGVIHRRGVMIPIIDLRLRFGFQRIEED